MTTTTITKILENDGPNTLVEAAKEESERETRQYLGRHLQELTAQQIRDCFPGQTITDEMLQGFRMAAELVADPNFDY